MMSIRRLYDEHKEVIARTERTERTKIEKRGVGRPLLGPAKFLI